MIRLYDRLLEALKIKLKPAQVMVLLNWEQAKAAALQKHRGNRFQLYYELANRGLAIEYAAVTSLYREEAFETIAPQQYGDMKVLAEYSGRYPTEDLIRMTFRVIQQERGRRRAVGRALRSLLRSIISGHGYDEALAGAKEIGSELTEVLAAVEIRRVQGVRAVEPKTNRPV